jgi:hypothetical protein
MNGTMIYSMNDTNNYLTEENLVIGNESNPSNVASFGGYMYYFHWVKGTALYTTDFTITVNYPSVISNTVLLLTALGSSGTLGNTVQNNNVSTFAIIPTPPSPPPPPPEPTESRMYMPLFTNNAQVYYKRGSLASCGVGSVRNSSMKGRRT